MCTPITSRVAGEGQVEEHCSSNKFSHQNQQGDSRKVRAPRMMNVEWVVRHGVRPALQTVGLACKCNLFAGPMQLPWRVSVSLT